MAQPRRNEASRSEALVAIRLTHAERDTLRAAAQAQGTTMSDLLRERVADLIPAGSRA